MKAHNATIATISAATIDSLDEGFCEFGPDQKLVFGNKSYAEIYKLPARLLVPGTPHAEITAYRIAHGMRQIGSLQSFMERHNSILTDARQDITLVELPGDRTISIHHCPLPPGGWVSTHHDISDDLARVVALQHRESELAVQNGRFEAAVDNMSQGLCMFDASQKLVICNAMFAQIYNLPVALTRPGADLADIFAHRMATAQISRQMMLAQLEKIGAVISTDATARMTIEQSDGRVVSICVKGVASGGWVATNEDVTIQVRQTEQIAHLARHDAMTNLPNRAHFLQSLASLESPARNNQLWAALYIDLDGFKPVNDTLGHAAGDQMLKIVADRLRQTSRRGELVARLGGDEFAKLIGPIPDASHAKKVADRLIAAISKPADIFGHKVRIGASVGIALSYERESDAGRVLRDADAALYVAKREGKNRVCITQYPARTRNSGGRDAHAEQVQLERPISFNYAPRLDVSNRLAGFALMPERPAKAGPDDPDQAFALIAAALEKPLTEAARWPAGTALIIPLTTAALLTPGFAAKIRKALKRAGFESQNLEFALSDPHDLLHSATASARLKTLRRAHIAISAIVPDAGTLGFEALTSTLFDLVMIDRLQKSGSDKTALRAFEALGAAADRLGVRLGLANVASEIDVEAAFRSGASVVEGPAISPPLAEGRVTDFARAFRPRTAARRERLTRSA